MKRLLAVLILLILPSVHASDIVSNIVKNTQLKNPDSKLSVKTMGSGIFAVGTLLYIFSTWRMRKKFQDVVGSHKELLNKNTAVVQEFKELDIYQLREKEGFHNLWASCQTLAVCSMLGGSFLLGMSMEDSFNLI